MHEQYQKYCECIFSYLTLKDAEDFHSIDREGRGLASLPWQ